MLQSEMMQIWAQSNETKFNELRRPTSATVMDKTAKKVAADPLDEQIPRRIDIPVEGTSETKEEAGVVSLMEAARQFAYDSEPTANQVAIIKKELNKYASFQVLLCNSAMPLAIGQLLMGEKWDRLASLSIFSGMKQASVEFANSVTYHQSVKDLIEAINNLAMPQSDTDGPKLKEVILDGVALGKLDYELKFMKHVKVIRLNVECPFNFLWNNLTKLAIANKHLKSISLGNPIYAGVQTDKFCEAFQGNIATKFDFVHVIVLQEVVGAHLEKMIKFFTIFNVTSLWLEIEMASVKNLVKMLAPLQKLNYLRLDIKGDQVFSKSLNKPNCRLPQVKVLVIRSNFAKTKLAHLHPELVFSSVRVLRFMDLDPKSHLLPEVDQLKAVSPIWQQFLDNTPVREVYVNNINARPHMMPTVQPSEKVKKYHFI